MDKQQIQLSEKLKDEDSSLIRIWLSIKKFKVAIQTYYPTDATT